MYAGTLPSCFRAVADNRTSTLVVYPLWGYSQATANWSGYPHADWDLPSATFQPHGSTPRHFFPGSWSHPGPYFSRVMGPVPTGRPVTRAALPRQRPGCRREESDVVPGDPNDRCEGSSPPLAGGPLKSGGRREASMGPPCEHGGMFLVLVRNGEVDLASIRAARVDGSGSGVTSGLGLGGRKLLLGCPHATRHNRRISLAARKSSCHPV